MSGAITASKTFGLSTLEALPVTTETVGAITYTGVSLWDLPTSIVGVPTDASAKNDILDKYVVATGSDSYRVVFSLGELDPAFGDEPDLVAYLADGAGLAANGFAGIVVPDDVKAGRWVSNLVGLEVFSATAVREPGTMALLFGGFGAVLVAARRRVRTINAGSCALRSPA